ncbi:MAG TPA: hypothetical protein VFC86_08670 [Planctomycetota bacterium]|nr:hypothetical protein [Planctomycetota bacterium]
MLSALVVSLAALQGPAEWERFAPGSWAQFATSGRQDGAKVSSIEKSVFKDATSTDVVISIEKVEDAGGRSVVEMKFPLPQRSVPKEDEGMRTGDATLAVDGKSFACEVYERKGLRRWVCPSAPVNKGVLKTESIAGTVQLTTRVLNLEDKVKVGETTLACWVLEEITEVAGEKTVKTTWRCDEVPGGVVRQKTRQTRGTETIVDTVTTLTAFHVVKK